MTEIYYVQSRCETWIDIINIDFRHYFQIKADIKLVPYLV